MNNPNHHKLDPNGAAILTNGSFANDLTRIIRETKPLKLIETGTCVGLGSTKVILDALGPDSKAQFFSIEVNPTLHDKATTNLAAYPNISLVYGLSVPRELLPTSEEIKATCDLARQYGVDVDPNPGEESSFYGNETNFLNAQDDCLRTALAHWDNKPDFVMLDSSGGMGYIEFKYLLSLVQGPFILALDDVHHVKHFQSYRQILRDQRFTILAIGNERHGYLIARFDPTKGRL